MKHKIDNIILIEAVKNSQSMGHLFELLNVPKNGGSYATFKKKLKLLNIDTSHWEYTRKMRQSFKNKAKISRKVPLSSILIENSKYSRGALKKRLLSEKIFECKCYNCNNTTWMNVPIPLQLEHINGIRDDNRIDNLTLLCPNCHALTDTYCGKNIKYHANKVLSDETLIKIIPECSSIKEVLKVAKLSSAMDNYVRIRNIINQHNLTLKKHNYTDDQISNFLSRRKAERPTKEELSKLIWELPTTKIAKKYNVTDNAVAKWCVFYGLSKPPRGYWAKLKSKISPHQFIMHH